jgi:hypothetical protein
MGKVLVFGEKILVSLAHLKCTEKSVGNKKLVR